MNDTAAVTTPLQSTRKLPYSRPNSRIGHGRRPRTQFPARPADVRPSLSAAYRSAMTTAATNAPNDSQQAISAVQPTMQQRFDFAFSLYSTRAREEMHEFRALCAAIAHGAHEEKRQWQALCARVMQERDACKAKLQELVTEQRQVDRRRSLSASPVDQVKQESPEPTTPSAETSVLGKRHAEPENFSVDDTRSLLLSPGSPPPETPLQVSPTNSVPPVTHSPSPSDGESSSSSSSRGSPSPSCSEHSHHSSHEHPAKRRRSSMDSTADLPASLDTANARRTPAPPLATDFTHVDLMYNRQMNGALVCRACLFESEKSDIYIPPTTFPARASWDALRHHCVYAHPTECADIARLHPAEIYHLRQRMNSL